MSSGVSYGSVSFHREKLTLAPDASSQGAVHCQVSPAFMYVPSCSTGGIGPNQLTIEREQTGLTFERFEITDRCFRASATVRTGGRGYQLNRTSRLDSATDTSSTYREDEIVFRGPIAIP